MQSNKVIIEIRLKKKSMANGGMPCAVKIACTVWSRGKGSDSFKT
jgi:hypothetical protein